MFTSRFPNPALLLFLVLLASTAAAKDEEDSSTSGAGTPGEAAMSLDEVALELSHPATSLVYMDNRFEFRDYQGNLSDASDQSAGRYEFETVWPIALKNGKNLQLRAIVPINADQPLYEMGKKDFPEWKVRQYADVLPTDSYFTQGHDHLDDITLGLAYTNVSDTGLLTLFGARLVLPTSMDLSSGRDQFLLGPELAVGKVASWGVIGATVSHVTNVGGDGGYNTNMSEIDVFFAWSLGNGWQIISNPKIEYDWEGVDQNKLMLPLGGGVSKTFRIRRTPIKLDMELYKYIESPEALGPDWMFSFRLTPVLFTP